jgi:hypothetical protein
MQAAQRERERELSAQNKREEVVGGVSDISQQPPGKEVKLIYRHQLLRYSGPEPRPLSQYKAKYRPDKELCKDGWCRHEFTRKLAIGAILDLSDMHNLA